MADAYDLQGKPLRKGVLVGFYYQPAERLVAGRSLGMSNGKVRVSVQLGVLGTVEFDMWPKRLVVLEEPIWPNS